MMGKGLFDCANPWQQISLFRKSPRLYLNSHNVTEDDFVVDILQDLWNDRLPTSGKLQLLNLLQEFCSSLLTSDSSVEQAIASLQELYPQTVDADGALVLRSQILITITEIIIVHGWIMRQVRPVLAHVECLLDTIRSTNRPADFYLRSRACHCLLQLEMTYPCILSSKLEHLSHLWSMENTAASSVYLALFTTTLDNVISKLAASQIRLPDDCLSNAICNRTEPLLPFNLPVDARLETIQTQLDETSQLPANISSRELVQSLGVQVASLTITSPPIACFVIRRISRIFAKIPGLSSLFLQPFLTRFSSTQDLQALHTLLHLMRATVPLLSSKDCDLILRHIVSCTNHSSIHFNQRILLCQLLTGLADAQSLPLLVHNSPHDSFLNDSFGNFDVRCMKIVSLCDISHCKNQDGAPCDFIAAFRCLTSPLDHLMSNPVALSTLFQALHLCLPIMPHKDVQLFLVELYKRYVEFTPHILDLMHAAEQIISHRFSAEVVLLILDDILCQTQIKQEDLAFYLQVIQVASKLEQLPLHKTLQYLLLLVQEDDLTSEGDWELGNRFLAICHELMRHQTPLPPVFGDILHALMSKYCDLDIQDRATLYYAMWTLLSPEKLETVLMQSPVSTNGGTISNIMHDRSRYSPLPGITQLNQSAFLLERFDKPVTVQQEFDWTSGSVEDYLNFLDSEKCPIQRIFSFGIKLNPQNDLTEVYSIVLKFDAGDHFDAIPDLCIHHLAKDPESPDHSHQFNLQLHPKLPIPSYLNIQAVMSGPENATLQCQLPPVRLDFHDLWHPLFLQEGLELSQRLDLIKALQNHIFREKEKSLKSVHPLKCSSHDVTRILSNHFQPFIIEENDCVLLAAFLPPNEHLFLSFEMKASDCSICHIAISNSIYLPLVSEFLTNTFPCVQS